MIPAAILALIPGCAGGQVPLAEQLLPGGRGCNVVTRVDTAAGRFVLRQRQPPLDRPGSVAQMELRSQQVAAAAGIAPRLVECAPDGSWLLMEFIDAPLWDEQQLLSREGAEALGTRLCQLHGLPVPPGLPMFDADAVARAYLEQIRAADPEAAAAHQPLLSRIRVLSWALQDAGVPAALNHGDLQAGNLLGRQPVLVDWEYAQVADPTYDIACLLTYYPRLEAQLGPLLGSAGLSNTAERAVLALQRERFGCLNRLWNMATSAKAG